MVAVTHGAAGSGLPPGVRVDFGKLEGGAGRIGPLRRIGGAGGGRPGGARPARAAPVGGEVFHAVELGSSGRPES